MKKLFTISFLITLNSFTLVAQNISSTLIEYEALKSPIFTTEESARTYKVAVTSPYNLTSEDVIAQSKVDFENEVKKITKPTKSDKKKK